MVVILVYMFSGFNITHLQSIIYYNILTTNITTTNVPTSLPHSLIFPANFSHISLMRILGNSLVGNLTLPHMPSTALIHDRGVSPVETNKYA